MLVYYNIDDIVFTLGGDLVTVKKLFCDWIIHSRDLLKNADSFSNGTSEVFMIESLNHSFKRFVKKCWFIQ